MSYPDSLSQITSEYEAAFELIDVVFSLESCMQHQILPLELLDNHLVMGMVNPKSIETIQFIQPNLQSLGYSFHVQAIDAQTHQLIIATYLQCLPNKSISAPSSSESSNHSADNLSSIQPPGNNNNNSVSEQMSNNYSPTMFEDYGDDEEIDDQEISDNNTNNLHERPTLIFDKVQTPIDNISFEYDNSKIFSSQPQIDNSISNKEHSEKNNLGQSTRENFSDVLPNKKIEVVENSITKLTDLPPKQLWQELLARAISGGIGRLFFRQLASHGHIMCSRDGVIQSSLEDVPLDVFSEVIQEIKKMAKLPLTKLKKNKKVALQKFHDEERVLLRGEFFIGEFGDEITLQVLRGQALHFYEQRQVDKTLKKAIYLGRQLERTLRKIKMCSTSADLGDLKALKATLKQVDKRLRLLDS